MKNLNTIIATATLFCSMALVQRTQAQEYNALQDFTTSTATGVSPNLSGGLTVASPATSATTPNFTQAPSDTPVFSASLFVVVPDMSSLTSQSYYGGYSNNANGAPISSPVGGDIAVFNGQGQANLTSGTDVAYTMTFGELPPATTNLTLTFYAVNPLHSYGIHDYVTTILNYTVTDNVGGTEVPSTEVDLAPMSVSPANTVSATGWTKVTATFEVPPCATSLTLTITNPYTATNSGNDFVLAGISLSTFSDPFSEAAQGSVEQADACPLPITGLQLTAQPKGNTVNLSWGTLTEINSKTFTVQRSADGGKTWIIVTTQPTKAVNGNSSVPLSYTAQDIVLQSSEYEYRVVETDIDGSTTISNVATVTVSTNGSAVYPNPTKSLLNVVLLAGVSSASYRMISSDGKIVLSGTMTNAGNHGTISVAGIASGVYFLQVTVNNTMQTYEVQIQQ